DREDIASRAAELYPEQSISWFWLGELANTGPDRFLAAFYFERSMLLNPSDGLAWCRLGRIYEGQEMFEDSFQAYAQCCQNGDPGSHGCFGAGRLSEKLGNIPMAIEYYQRSHHEPALDRAEELEAEQ
ncbi:MAG: hypothetical protein GWO10_08350, partial [candidate division Zixibacteria bacterium]|nr:hypothetical protein [candidate division Zixibacteria bacterium]NIW44650.1 hypothetical protein [Gammaproteobacteria bacterium]